MNTKTWNILQPPADAVDRLVAELGVSATLATVLANRGAADPDAARSFLNPRSLIYTIRWRCAAWLTRSIPLRSPCAKVGAS